MEIDEKLMLSVIKDASFIAELRVLAIEYNAKTITPERFAARTYEMLRDHLTPDADKKDSP